MILCSQCEITQGQHPRPLKPTHTRSLQWPACPWVGLPTCAVKRAQCTMQFRFQNYVEPDVIYCCRLVAPGQFLEYPLSIFGACNHMSSCPPVGGDLVIVVTLHSGKQIMFYRIKQWPYTWYVLSPKKWISSKLSSSTCRRQ